MRFNVRLGTWVDLIFLTFVLGGIISAIAMLTSVLGMMFPLAMCVGLALLFVLFSGE